MKNIKRATRFLGECCKGRDNNFDFLRFVAASMVIFSHAHAIAGNYGASEPLVAFTRHTMSFGGLAVRMFFVMSGFLITASYLNRLSFTKFWRARLLRIMPGLIVAVVVSIFLIGSLGTSLPLREYFTRTQTYAYFQTILLLPINLLPYNDLPNVFSHNVRPNAVNGSLWTLTPEMMCYLLVSLMGVTGLLRRWTALSLLIITFVTYYLVYSGMLHVKLFLYLMQHLELAVCFAAGMTFHMYRSRVPINGFLAIGSLAALLVANHFTYLNYAFPFFGAYLVLYLSYCHWLKCTKFAKNGDFSYGIYIYAFPIQQLVTHCFGGHMAVWLNYTISFPITLVVAALSWHLVEKRFLRIKSFSFRRILTNS